MHKKNTKSQLKIANLVNSIKDSEKPKKIFSELCLTHVPGPCLLRAQKYVLKKTDFHPLHL
jgi:hypothetical protein